MSIKKYCHQEIFPQHLTEGMRNFCSRNTQSKRENWGSSVVLEQFD